MNGYEKLRNRISNLEKDIEVLTTDPDSYESIILRIKYRNLFTMRNEFIAGEPTGEIKGLSSFFDKITQDAPVQQGLIRKNVTDQFKKKYKLS